MKLFKKRKTKINTKEQPDNNENNEIIEDTDKLENIFEKHNPSVLDVIGPDGLKVNDEDFGVLKQSLASKTFFRPFYIPRDGYPRKLQTNWLNEITSSGEMDLLIDIQKVKKSDAVVSLQQQYTMLLSNLSMHRKRGNVDQFKETETKLADTDVLMDEVQFSENDIYNVAVLGALWANSEKELDTYSESLEDELAGSFIKIAPTWSRVKQGLKSILPMGNVKIKDAYRNIDRRALSTFAPFIHAGGKFHGGIPFGLNKITNQLEFINTFGNDTYRPKNYNDGFIGVSGSGKSLAMKMKSIREALTCNIHFASIDPEGEFVKMTKRIGGINLNISEEENICINPCAINVSELPLDDDDLDTLDELSFLEEDAKREIIEKNGVKYVRFVPIKEKTNEITAFFDIIVKGKDSDQPGLDVFEINYLEEAISHTFNELGITSHPSSLFENDVKEVDGQIIQSKVKKPEPTIGDIYTYIKGKFGEDQQALRLIAAIKPFLKTGSKPIFDGQTYLGKGVVQSLKNNRMVNFNLSKMEEGFLKPIAYHVILNFLWEHFLKDPANANKKKIVICDEIWQLVDYEAAVIFLEKVSRRARKRNAGLRFASQDFVRLVENPKARGILTNTQTMTFFEQHQLDEERISQNYNLSDAEKEIIFGNPEVGEAIVKVGKNSIWIKTNPSEDEMTFLESNEAVLQAMLKKKAVDRGIA